MLASFLHARFGTESVGGYLLPMFAWILMLHSNIVYLMTLLYHL
jgi:hypothetical protein